MFSQVLEIVAAQSLRGARILLVEDEFLIGLEVATILEDAGVTVIGPKTTLPAAMAAVSQPDLAGAVLDIRLGEVTTAPVAQALAARNIPFLFYTGQTQIDPLRLQWPRCVILSKPAQPASLLSSVAGLLI